MRHDASEHSRATELHPAGETVTRNGTHASESKGARHWCTKCPVVRAPGLLPEGGRSPVSPAFFVSASQGKPLGKCMQEVRAEIWWVGMKMIGLRTNMAATKPWRPTHYPPGINCGTVVLIPMTRSYNHICPAQERGLLYVYVGFQSWAQRDGWKMAMNQGSPQTPVLRPGPMSQGLLFFCTSFLSCAN